MSEFDTLKGLRHSEQLVVEHKDTAAVYGSGALEVFATPAMIALMEKTCLMGVSDKIGEGNTTVGIAVNIKHLKASPVGSIIRCEAELVEVDRRRLVFEVKCFEGTSLVGEGIHERFVVESKKFMSKFLQTERILLRPWRDDDAEALFKYASDPEVGPRAGWPPHKSVEESLEIIRTVFHNDTNWAIELKATGEAIGAIGYGPSCDCQLPAREGEPLCGYWIGKPYWNQSICTEALRVMLNLIRQTTDIKSLISGHFVDNPASGRVMEKCGFIPTGETCIDESQYQGKDRPIRVLRLEL